MIRCDNAGGLAYYSRMGFGDDQPAAETMLKSGMKIARVHKRFVLVVSTGRCNTSFKFLCWRLVLQGLSRPLV